MSRKSDKIWEIYFGNSTKAYDAFDRLIYKNKYIDNSHYSEKGVWTLDHIFPRKPLDDNYTPERRGSDSIYNLQPLSVVSNQEKGSSLRGKVNGITFSIKIIQKNDSSIVGRMMVKLGDTWYWAYE